MAKEPLVCDFAQARIGCRMIADHIFELAESSQAILNFVSRGKDRQNALRSAYILNLIGYEEAGKLFMMWQALAEAERKGLNEVRIEEFELHDSKGDLAGDLCCQMMGFAESRYTEVMSSFNQVPMPEADLAVWQVILAATKSSASAHRERIFRIRRHFKQEREDAMYIDFRRGDWVIPPQLSHPMLAMDCRLLEIIAKASNAYLLEGLSFSSATKAISDLNLNVKSEEADMFLRVLSKNEPKWFSLLKPEI